MTSDDALMPPMKPDVKTSTGIVRGRWENGVAVYRGVSFAAPPVGPRRFAAPQPAEPWQGVRDAKSFRAVSAGAGPGDRKPRLAEPHRGWEDLTDGLRGDAGWPGWSARCHRGGW